MIGSAAGDSAVNSTRTYAPVGVPAQVPVSATVEPDVDGDGFGDETQEKCPRSRAIQTECPPVTLDSVLTPGKTSLAVLVTASPQAPVSVSGVVTVAKPPKKARRSATKQIKLAKVTQTVAVGQIARFKLKFPSSLLSALRSLPSRKSAKAKITVSATDQVGVATTVLETAKLKGQFPKR